jgi:hypothetical protein
MRRCSLQLLGVVPLVEMRGITTPGHIEHRNISLTRAVLGFVLRWHCASWTSIMALNFLFLRDEPKKCHSRHRPSDRRRLAFGDSAILCICDLAKVLLFCLPRPLLLLGLSELFTFSVVFPFDVTSAESRLVR